MKQKKKERKIVALFHFSYPQKKVRRSSFSKNTPSLSCFSREMENRKGPFTAHSLLSTQTKSRKPIRTKSSRVGEEEKTPSKMGLGNVVSSISKRMDRHWKGSNQLDESLSQSFFNDSTSIEGKKEARQKANFRIARGVSWESFKLEEREQERVCINIENQCQWIDRRGSERKWRVKNVNPP